MKAKDLINSSRLDLVIKYLYVQAKLLSRENRFIKECYEKHIEAFTNGEFLEFDNPKKNSLDKYVDDFDKLIESISKDGFDLDFPVPIDKSGLITNGAHRTAIAAYLDIDIPTVLVDGIAKKFDSEFFKKRLLDTKYIDYMVLEYCKFKNKDIYTVCLWPVANNEVNKNELLAYLNECSKIIYNKDLALSFEGLLNLQFLAYSHQEWIGDLRAGYSNVERKATRCFKKDSNVTIVVVEDINYTKIFDIKQKLRSIFGMGNDSLHITDSCEESICLLNTLLNENSIHLLNHSNIFKYTNNYLEYSKFKNVLNDNNLNYNDFIIDSSSIMGLYGIRECSDVDYLSLAENEILNKNGYDYHGDYLKFYSLPLTEILYNPDNYVVFNNLKFCSLQVVNKMKFNRNELKDREDCKLINKFYKNDFTFVFEKFYVDFKRKVRNIYNRSKYKVKMWLRDVLINVKLYNFAKKIYHFIKD